MGFIQLHESWDGDDVFVAPERIVEIKQSYRANKERKCVDCTAVYCDGLQFPLYVTESPDVIMDMAENAMTEVS